MFQYQASENRQIVKFPASFKVDCTPYAKSDFSAATKNFCEKNRGLYAICLRVCKIIVLGDVCVGKTSIINRFCCKLFESTYKSTIGVDFQVEQFDILGVPYNLQIWDTAGQERFKSIAQSYYRGAHVIITVFDLSTIQTLFHCRNWLSEALGATHSPHIFVVGTKKDLLSDQAYLNTETLAESTAGELGAEFWSVSSKTGENIDELFSRIAALSFDDCISNAIEKPGDSGVKIGNLISIKKNAPKKNKCSSCGI